VCHVAAAGQNVSRYLRELADSAQSQRVAPISSPPARIGCRKPSTVLVGTVGGGLMQRRLQAR
jgi:hypothetical protein